jgi:hypothetical protein
MKRAGRQEQRGYALFTVVVLMGAGALAAALLLDVLHIDLLVGRNERQVAVARELAEGGVMEVIGDLDTGDQLPLLDDTDLAANYQASSDALFAGSGAGHAQVDVTLLRIVPLSESSVELSRAVVHEIRSVGESNDGSASYTIRTEIYRTVAMRPGTILPRRHGR